MGLDHITIEGAREHNLKKISVTIPRNSLTVITGDILAYHAEFLADPAMRALYQPGVRARFEANSSVPLDAYINARSRMIVARKTIHEAFSDFDVFIGPTVAMPAHRIDDALNNPPDELLIIRNTIQFNTLGNPVIHLAVHDVVFLGVLGQLLEPHGIEVSLCRFG